MKLLTSAALAASLCITSVTPAIAENIVGSVKAWQYMQADGWTSADGYDDNHMHNALYQAVVLDNYPSDESLFSSQQRWRLALSGRQKIPDGQIH